MALILIVDDNPGVRAALRLLCELHHWRCTDAATPHEALAQLKADTSQTIDLVLQDMNFQSDTTSGEEGIALFQDLRQIRPDLPIVLLTAWTHLDHAVRLVRAGAADYLPKPWDDQKLVTTIENLLELNAANRRLMQQSQQSRARKSKLTQDFDVRDFVYADDAMLSVLQLCAQIARSDLPILITGPNGCGKERIAELIQANSSVKTGPFVTLNCGALPAELIESELFGSEAGAYTGAKTSRAGKFEAADGGTLFLDEIGNLPLAGQIKLLRVLETGRFQRLGSNTEKQVRVRVLSATNADLSAMIRQLQFREDLYYRLNCITVAIPALKDRRLDIPLLAQHVLQGDKALSADAMQVLQNHDWPGNVRELKNTLQRAKLLARGAYIEVADLALPVASAGLLSVEPTQAEIEFALLRHQGVVAQAAAELGLSRQALYRRMDRFGMKRE
jgi:DNA-binding NtrC family response regulator